jgi:hypothetical protein
MKVRVFCILLLLCLLPEPLAAKGQLTRITIQRDAQSAPLEIRDDEILRRFSPWAGPGVWVEGVEQTQGFIIDWSSGAMTRAPKARQAFDVRFYVKYYPDQPEELAYQVSYAYDPKESQDAVYLPGKGDAQYPVNVRSIVRGIEGKWFRPTSEWQALARVLIAQSFSR